MYIYICIYILLLIIVCINYYYYYIYTRILYASMGIYLYTCVAVLVCPEFIGCGWDWVLQYLKVLLESICFGLCRCRTHLCFGKFRSFWDLSHSEEGFVVAYYINSCAASVVGRNTRLLLHFLHFLPSAFCHDFSHLSLFCSCFYSCSALKGVTPLHDAAHMGNVQIVRLLLESCLRLTFRI